MAEENAVSATRTHSSLDKDKTALLVEVAQAGLGSTETVEQSDDLEGAHPRHKSTTRKWAAKKAADFSAAHPRSHSRVSRALLWLRGPRPKEELPHPNPILDIDFTVRGRRVRLPLESMLIKWTRPIRKPWLFFLLAAAYIIGIAFLSKAQSFSEVQGTPITCTGTLWRANNQCGLNGSLCLPLNTSSTIDFRCPPGCSGTILANPRTVGDQSIAYVPLIVGGGDADKTYRADSFVCAAAIHSGALSRDGGCGRLQLVGDHTDFVGSVSHGLESLGFPTTFPLGFRFAKEEDVPQCKELRHSALGLNVAVTALLFLAVAPKAILAYWSLVCIGFWHISLFSDPAGPLPDIERQMGLFLPLLFIAYVFWRVAYRHVLPVIMRAPIEACVLYGAPFWIGLLNNLTFDRLPLDRLTASDIGKRSGSIATLVVLIVVLVVCGLNQLRVIRKTGWLPHYVGWYIVGGLVLMVLALLPTLSLRLHHYIIPMLIIPATAFPTRASAIYQGLLLGLFLHGIARWDFASIVQTAASLRRDAVLGSVLPSFSITSGTYNSSMPINNQTLTWEPILESDRHLWAGFSLLIDDVERYVGLATNYSLAALDASLPHFFRLAYGSDALIGDYTNAATLWPNGTWVDPLPGPSY